MTKLLKILFICLFLVTLQVGASQNVNAESGDLTQKLQDEMDEYLKPINGTISIHYKNLITEKGYSLKSKEEVRAASTIKLPLALYVMKLAEEGKLDLNKKLTYKSHHYYGGSGVIQKDKVGTSYTIEDLLHKAIVYSDNIAFIMLKEHVGANNFISFMKELGGTYTYPNGRNMTSAYDLHLYAKELYHFSQTSKYGEKLITDLKNTIYNTTIPEGIKETEVAHKVGMIPMDEIYNDVAIVFTAEPYTLAIATSGIQYEKSQKVIADIAAIIHKHHLKMSQPQFFQAHSDLPIYNHESEGFEKIGELRSGEEYKISSDYGNWHEIDFGYTKGYVWKEGTELKKTSELTGFVKSYQPFAGAVKLLDTAAVFDNTSGVLVPFATLQKGVSYPYVTKMKNWFMVYVAGRYGYLSNKVVEEQFTNDTKYFKVKEDVPIYDNSTGKLVKIGELYMGQVFTRMRDYGNWHEISLGDRKGYVWKESTVPATKEEAVLSKQPEAIGEIKLLEEVTIYDNNTRSLIPIATVVKGEKLDYSRKEGNWFSVYVGNREGFIYKDFVDVIEQDIRVTFAGDAMMDWSVKNTVKQKGADYPFVHVKKELANSEIGIVNLETAVTTSSSKYPKKYNFKSDPASLAGLKNAGFDLVSLANNHTLDYQTGGLKDTLASLKKHQLDYIGGGVNNTEAYAAKTYDINGKRITFLAFSRVLPSHNWVATKSKPGLANGYDLKLMINSITKEKKKADYVFVYIHWGVEKSRKPEAFQRTWAKNMIDAGADGIIGSHPHVLQGFEFYKGKPIAYSIGNFLFPDYVKGDKAQTGLLHIDIRNNNLELSFTPYKIYKDQIIPQSDKEKQTVWKELESLSYGDVKVRNGRVY